jgi:hypothetical protein
MNLSLNDMRLDSAIKQKKGLHFILASVFIWCAVLVIHLTTLNNLTKNLLTFCFTAPLVPLAFLISKLIKVDFTNKDNPLTSLGVLFSVNQMLYLMIAIWIYNAIPEKMVMVLAMIFGAHLLPYGWLYKSTSYMVLSVIIPIAALVVGIVFPPFMVAGFMIIVEIVFSVFLFIEIKKLPASAKGG